MNKLPPASSLIALWGVALMTVGSYVALGDVNMAWRALGLLARVVGVLILMVVSIAPLRQWCLETWVAVRSHLRANDDK
jgi:hypothetical protein